MITSERVVDILVGEGGYRLLPKPLKVGSLSFDFTDVLAAGGRANDLVIVIELRGDTADDAVIRKVLALTRALDVLQSKRSVTAVLTSGQAAPETVQSLSRVCRVLPVGSPSGANAVGDLRDWLSALLPLSQPPAVDTFVDWEGDLRRAIPADAAGPLMDELLRIAPDGRSAIEEALARSIAGSVNAALAKDDEEDV
jgi:hypothetical protein